MRCQAEGCERGKIEVFVVTKHPHGVFHEITCPNCKGSGQQPDCEGQESLFA